MRVRATSLSPRLQRLVGWRSRSGACLSRRKQWVCAYVEAFSLSAFGLFSRPPHEDQLRRDFYRLRANLRYWDREVPGKRERRRGGERTHVLAIAVSGKHTH